jgi:hypothetical protein
VIEHDHRRAVHRGQPGGNGRKAGLLDPDRLRKSLADAAICWLECATVEGDHDGPGGTGAGRERLEERRLPDPGDTMDERDARTVRSDQAGEPVEFDPAPNQGFGGGLYAGVNDRQRHHPPLSRPIR